MSAAISATTGVSAASAAASTAVSSGATSIAASSGIAALMMNGFSNNKYVLGIMILLLNLGSRYIGYELSEFHHKVLNHTFARRLLIFIVLWMGTRDVVVSMVITTCFIVLVSELLNENSKYCILPKASNVNITPEEYLLAKEIIQKYEKMNPNNIGSANMNMMPGSGSSSSSSSGPQQPK